MNNNNVSDSFEHETCKRLRLNDHILEVETNIDLKSILISNKQIICPDHPLNTKQMETGNLSEEESIFMDKAFFYAYEALSVQEVPVGCIFVYNNQIIALGRNTVNETHNATRHAEINCIDQVNEFCRNANLEVKDVFNEITAFITVEPCIMCAAALFDMKVKSVIYGCKNDRFGGETVYDVASILKPITTVKGGYRSEEAMNLLREFYKGTNVNAPLSKVKTKGKKLK